MGRFAAAIPSPASERERVSQLCGASRRSGERSNW
jgi:hypothetical protein